MRDRVIWTAMIIVLSALGGPVFADLAPEPGEEEVPALEVRVTGLRSDKGLVVLSLYDDAKGFPGKGKPVRTLTGEIEDGAVRFEFGDLAPGTYGISVMHDEDGDGELRTNIIGMPKEGVGASNNAKMRFGPPKWKDAKFEIGDEPVVQKIVMVYL